MAHRAYLEAIKGVFGVDVDYAMLIKVYGNNYEDRRYSPGEVIGTETVVKAGRPDPRYISTSFVERQNPNDAHVDAPVHEVNECLLEEGPAS